MNGTKRSLLCILSLLLFAAVIMTSAVYAAENASVWQGGVSESLAGEGTETDPYLIATGDDLACFSKLVAAGDTFSGKYVKLVSDIDMGGAAFYPIGYDETASYVECDRAFSGTFDGDGHYVEVSIHSEGTAGLFGVVSGTVKNVKVYGEVENTFWSMNAETKIRQKMAI